MQACFGDAEQNRHRRRRATTRSFHLSIQLIELELVHLLILQELGIARIGDFHLLQHLPDDYFDVLVVNRHALQAVNLLDLIDEE